MKHFVEKYQSNSKVITVVTLNNFQITHLLFHGPGRKNANFRFKDTYWANAQAQVPFVRHYYIY